MHEDTHSDTYTSAYIIVSYIHRHKYHDMIGLKSLYNTGGRVLNKLKQ